MLLFVFVLTIAVSAYFQLFGTDIAFPLEKVRKTQSINLSLHDVHDFVFDLPIPARNYIILQGYLAPEQSISISISYIYLAVTALCLAFIAAAATYFSRLWFLIFQSILVIWIITLKLPYLSLFGIDNQLFNFAFVVLFLGVGYIFHAYKTEKSLFLKWLSFLGLIAVLFGFIAFGSSQESPLLFVAQHAVIIPIILAAIFIGNVAYDVLLHIVYILANKKTENEGSNLGHFIVLSLLYLGYVGLTFSRNDFLIRWDIVYLDEFLLLTVSAILGIWGFRKRNELINAQLSFAPLGAYLYLIFGILAFTTIGWIFATANDPLIDTFEDIIIFTHLGFGILFFFYVIFNFITFLMKGMNIYKVVLKPMRIPYNVVRIAGLGLVIVMVLRVSYTPYFQALAGYYSGIADFYLYTDKEDAAITSFKIAKQYAATTHKPNFNLGLNAYNNEEWVEASHYFSRANYKRPTVQAFLNKAQAQLNANLIFEALFTLQDAQQVFPDNAYILNMEGLIYDQLNKTDSSFLYFDAAYRASNDKELHDLALSNKLGLFAKNKVAEELPALAEVENGSIPLKANYLALSNLYKSNVGQDLFIAPVDSQLTYNDFSLLFNQVGNSSLVNQEYATRLKRYTEFKGNKTFQKSLKYVEALSKNFAGKQKEAYSLIFDLQNAEISDAGFYYLVQGFWLMDQGAYDQAVEKFERAEKLKMSKAVTYKVLALIKAGRLFEAANYYQKQFEGNTVNQEVLDDDPLYQFLQAKTTDLPPNFLYLWLQTNASLTSEERAEVEKRLEGTFFEKLILLEKADELIKVKAYQQALVELNNVEVSKTDSALFQYKNNLLLAIGALQSKPDLIQRVDTSELSVYPYNYKLMRQAFLAKANSSADVDSLMYKLGSENVFFENGIQLACDHFIASNNNDKAYDVLVDAARLNPESTIILKAYTLQALRMNMNSYAADALDDLEMLLSERDFTVFKEKYDKLRDQKAAEGW
jgi:Flp pilus assembly protein TadD